MITTKERTMLRISVPSLGLAAGLALAACAPPPYYAVYRFAELPPDYSPDYTYVPVIAPDQRSERWVLVPKACLLADPTEPIHLGPHLPPGCANAYNLIGMAERKSDLVEGRRLGAAPAAPSARAAQIYLYGEKGPLAGGLAVPPRGSPPSSAPQDEREKPAATSSAQP